MVAGLLLKKRYAVARLPLAHRGMGEVWPARDTLLDREVVIKLVSSSLMDADLARRFQREAQLTARFVHPGVPAIYDFDQHAGSFYMVLQKIQGFDLAELIDEHGPFPVNWVAAIGAQISSVLIAARRIGLVHRDIKPSNVMLEASGAVKVLDFGLAAIHEDDRYSRITKSGDSLGTAGYMAPEQIAGLRPDHRTDLYGLGATLFDLLTAQPPFDGPTPTITMRQQLRDSPPRPSALRPDIPALVDDLVHALMAPRPQDRPPSAAAVYEALAPLARDLPPIVGVVSDQPDPVRAYAAVVGQVPLPARPETREGLTAEYADPDIETREAEVQAQQLAASGERRAAAQQWRQLANSLAVQFGDEDATVVDYRIRAILLHVEVGERDRALRQLHSLRDSIDPDHPAMPAVQREIAKLSENGHDPPEHRSDRSCDRRTAPSSDR